MKNINWLALLIYLGSAAISITALVWAVQVITEFVRRCW